MLIRMWGLKVPGKTIKEGKLLVYTSNFKIPLHQKPRSLCIYVWLDKEDTILIQNITIFAGRRQRGNFFFQSLTR